MLGFVFYLAYGAIVLKLVVSPGYDPSSYCLGIAKVQVATSLICALVYLIAMPLTSQTKREPALFSALDSIVI